MSRPASPGRSTPLHADNHIPSTKPFSSHDHEKPRVQKDFSPRSATSAFQRKAKLFSFPSCSSWRTMSQPESRNHTFPVQQFHADIVKTATSTPPVPPTNGRNSTPVFSAFLPAMYMCMGEQPAAGQASAMAAIMGGGGKLSAGLGWWWHTPHDTLDKIDPDNLVRDTRVYVHTLWRLLTDDVLPLDYRETAADLGAELETLAGRLDGRFDVAPLLGPGGRPGGRGRAPRRRSGAGQRGADGGRAGPGAARLHHRRPLLPRPGARPGAMAGAGKAPRAGRGHAGQRRGEVPDGGGNAGLQSPRLRARPGRRRRFAPPPDFLPPPFEGGGGTITRCGCSACSRNNPDCCQASPAPAP